MIMQTEIKWDRYLLHLAPVSQRQSSLQFLSWHRQIVLNYLPQDFFFTTFSVQGMVNCVHYFHCLCFLCLVTLLNKWKQHFSLTLQQQNSAFNTNEFVETVHDMFSTIPLYLYKRAALEMKQKRKKEV